MGWIITSTLLLIPSSFNKLSRKILQGLLDYFLPLSASEYNMEDVCWFLEQVSSNSSCFSNFFSSESAERSFLKNYLTRIFSIGCENESNHLIINSDQVNFKIAI